MSPEDIKKLLGTANRVVLCGHEHPDGDCIGSLTALGLALQGLGVTVVTLFDGPRPASFTSLCTVNPNDVNAFAPLPGDVTVAVDSATLARTVPNGLNFDLAIDHHVSHAPFAKQTLLRPEAPAAGLVVLELLDAWGVALTPAIADALFVAMLTDTGRFVNENMRPEVFAAAARLMEAGARVRYWQQSLFVEQSPAHVWLAGRLLARLELSDDGRVATGWLTMQDQHESGAAGGDFEGLVDLLRNIKGVCVAALVRGNEGGGARVSLRGTINVGAVAAKFGGGGHANAAGCTLPQEPPEAHAIVRKTLIAAVQASQD